MSLSIIGPNAKDQSAVLTPEAVQFLADLEREFGSRRRQLLEARSLRRARVRAGEKLCFESIDPPASEANWRVATIPGDLADRRVEITGPVDRKMVINALNSGAKCFMADFEDSSSPTWENMISGQQNLFDAVRRTISLKTEKKSYELKPEAELATLLVRPRGWHLEEAHAQLNGQAMSASLFDFGLYFFHNAAELVQRGSGPYFYLPKMEAGEEARLWNDVFIFAQAKLGVPRGTIRATCLVETVGAAYAMERILYELREHSSGLNAGRWDYIFSMIKLFGDNPECVLPDRSQITMTVPFMRAYTEMLVKTCHRRGAHAMGGMSAFVPSRKDEAVNKRAFDQVRADKEREAHDGFDGTWVAHPDLIGLAQEVFDGVLAQKPNQIDKQRDEINIAAEDIVNVTIEGAEVSLDGVRGNINVALQYLSYWLAGTGAAAIHNLMEDAATAEISRTQLWQWLQHQVTLKDGQQMTQALYSKICGEEFDKLTSVGFERLQDAKNLLDRLVLAPDLYEFLTTEAYSELR